MANCDKDALLQAASDSGFIYTGHRSKLEMLIEQIYEQVGSSSTVDDLLAAASSRNFQSLNPKYKRLALLQILIQKEGGTSAAADILSDASLSGFLFVPTSNKLDIANQLICDTSSTPPVDPVVSDWVARVEAAGGATPSTATQQAANTFYLAIVAAGIETKLRIANFIAPDSLVAARTPLIQNVGLDSWTEDSTIIPTLSVNGIDCSAGGCRWKCGATPTQIFTGGADDCGLIRYSYVSAKTGSVCPMGVQLGVAGFHCQDYSLSNFDRTQDVLGTFASDYLNTVNPVPGFEGYSACVRTSGANNMIQYQASSVDAHASIASRTSATNFLQNTQEIYFLSNNNNGAVAIHLPTTDTISFLAVSLYLTAAESSALFDAVQALRVALGGGFR